MDMLEFQQRDYDRRMKELKVEEERIVKYLSSNSASMTDGEVKKLKHTLTGIKMEQEEINQIMDGGFY
ncbi:MAG: hypothetical protein GX895_10570 [Clostridiales bacterium]|uniref:hypothetical protein n=1 Tax=Clostridium sp. N3C TaxID=1776758 RepID=UPI00092E1DBB|nr:hypothetical protein [Clostridium sp. N3C]NLZ49204.1 hypothetical protein [Clostridiales bacterium]SCN24901.1 hypothetical protein N3C_2043 [Clostridium sp. N3C]